jgi:hypothetical protein
MTGPRMPRHPSRGDNTGALDPAVLARLPDTIRAVLGTTDRTARAQVLRAAFRGAWRWGLFDGLVLGCAGTLATVLLGHRWGLW